MFVVFCPVIIQLICAIIFLFIVLPMRNFYKRPDEQTLLASGSGDINDSRSVANKSDYGISLVDHNTIPSNKYTSRNFSPQPNNYYVDASREDSDTNLPSDVSVSDSIDHRLSSV
jgi:hypothetical protein